MNTFIPFMRVKRNMIAVENSSIFKRGLDSLALHIKAFNEEGRKNINGSFYESVDKSNKIQA